VVGLGAGTLAAYARTSDRITFYEINPEVEKVARTCFTFLRTCRGQVEVVLGDARLSLEHEVPNGFDLLVLDAFNSDSIPIHLLTKEAFEIYQRHITTNGIIAMHISNMSLNLEPIVCQLAHEFGYAAQRVDQKTSDEAAGILASTWILLQRAGAASKHDGEPAAGGFTRTRSCGGQLWTDDFNGLVTVLRWPGAKETPGLPTVLEFESTESGLQRSRAQAVMDRFRQAAARNPDSPLALNNLACLLATSSDPSMRNGEESVRLAEKACELTQYNNSSTLSTLAAAYAEAGRFDDAVTVAEKSCALAASRGEATILAGNQQMLKEFRQKRAFHLAP
jgi:predicted Zn-dependent protease